MPSNSAGSTPQKHQARDSSGAIDTELDPFAHHVCGFCDRHYVYGGQRFAGPGERRRLPHGPVREGAQVRRNENSHRAFAFAPLRRRVHDDPRKPSTARQKFDWAL